MTPSHRALTRRAWLGGAGTALVLPWLESLAPRGARADEPEPPRRLLCWFSPNGIVMPKWRPAGDDETLVLSPTLAPLAGLEDRLLVVSGLANLPAEPTDGPGGHETGTTGFLTTASIERAEDHVRASISMDQVLAAQLAGTTSRNSLQLGIEGGEWFGACANGFACAYSRAISWASPTAPLPPIVQPRVAFDLLFAGFDPSASVDASERRRRLRKSVLDAVGSDIARTQSRLGASDRAKLEQYLVGVRELELRVERGAPACDDAALARLEPLDVVEHVSIMNELIVLALRCDITRVVSFMLGNSASNRPFDFIGIPHGHHDLSHHAGDDAKIALLAEIDRWQVERLGDLLRALAAVPEAGETLLDHTLVLCSSEMSSGNLHAHTDLPVLLAGGATEWFQPGRHVRLDGDPPLAGLHLALLQGFGVAIERFGDDGETPIAGLVDLG